MPGIVTRRFRIHNAKQFKESVGEADPARLYVAIGRPNQWNDDENPPTPVDTYGNTTYEIWKPLYAAKKVSVNDVSFAVPRYNWQSNTVFEEYRSNDDTIYDKNFYVITDDRNVYKCLFNNNGAQTTTKPTGTSTSNIQTPDGYIWKFMYSVTAADALKFLTANYMPVKILESDDGSAQWQVQQTAANGSIEIIDVLSTGSNYPRNAGTLSDVANSTAVSLETNASTTDNLYNGSALYIDGGLGAGQIDEIIDYDGSSKQVILREGFVTTPNTSSTYSVAPLVTVSGDGTSATAYANVASGGVTKITMIDPGEDYSYAQVNITANNLAGDTATAVPYLSPFGGHGSDPLRELNGHNVMLNTKLTDTEANTIPSNNDFRVVTLIANPLEANGNFANSANYELATRLNIISVTGTFQPDEVIDGQSSETTSRALVYANTASSNGVLRVTDVRGEYIPQEIVTGNTSGATGTIQSIRRSQLKPFEGDVVYIENRTPVVRSTSQTEDIKLTIKF